MNVTVILCTHNRCENLSRTLDSIAASLLPNYLSWEVLVVDNNSTDRTREVVEDCCRRHPERLRYMFEAIQGKSHALNAGVRGAQGDILVFTDDDVTVEPTWLQNLTASLHNERWAGAGGRTLAERTFLPPRWLDLDAPHALAPLALFDDGPDARELTETPFGNNMAYRKEMFRQYGGFRIDLGPRAGSLVPQKCEDIEFGRRLLTAGEHLRYEPSAVVYHAVPESRIKREHFLCWWFDKAGSDIRAFGVPACVRWRLGGIPLVLFRRLIVWTLRWLVTVKPSRRFSCKLNVWSLAGQIVESYCLSRDTKGKRANMGLESGDKLN